MVIQHKGIPHVLSYKQCRLSLARGIVLPTPAQQWRSKSTSNAAGQGSQDPANAKLMNELPPPMGRGGGGGRSMGWGERGGGEEGRGRGGEGEGRGGWGRREGKQMQ